jgi:hypothetical protein
VVLVAAGLIDRRSRRLALVALLPLAVLSVALLVQSSQTYAARGRIGGLHGRYLYAGVVGFTAVAALGLDRILVRARRWVVPVAAAFAAGIELLALGMVLWVHRGADEAGFPAAWDAVLAWSPFGPIATVLIVAGGVGALVLLVVAAVRTARSEGRSVDRPSLVC